MKDTIVINSDFAKVVESHIYGNLLIEDTSSPLILGIFGPPGEGKTFQVEKVCQSLGVKTVIISPAEMESENAGQPGDLLRSKYLKIGGFEALYEPSVLIINDIDTVIGDWGEMVQYTVNRQVVFAQLMAFCAFPNKVSDKICRRVPIILTGNNPATMYGPLLRAGRMRLMEWKPTLDEKTEIISGIFPHIPKGKLRNTISKYSNEPISFWSDIKAFYWEEKLSEWIQAQNRQSLINNLKDEKRIKTVPMEIDVSTLENLAQRLKESSNIRSNYYTNIGRNKR